MGHFHVALRYLWQFLFKVFGLELAILVFLFEYFSSIKGVSWAVLLFAHARIHFLFIFDNFLKTILLFLNIVFELNNGICTSFIFSSRTFFDRIKWSCFSLMLTSALMTSEWSTLISWAFSIGFKYLHLERDEILLKLLFRIDLLWLDVILKLLDDDFPDKWDWLWLTFELNLVESSYFKSEIKGLSSIALNEIDEVVLLRIFLDSVSLRFILGRIGLQVFSLSV